MNERLRQIIRYKTRGRQKDFAELCGWTPQYVAKLLRGENFGLRPVITLLQTLPEVNARWLLLGEGEMLCADKRATLQRETLGRVQAMLELEQYIPVMSPEELRTYETALTTGTMPLYSLDTLARWERRADEHRKDLEARFAAANAKSEELCRQKTVKR